MPQNSPPHTQLCMVDIIHYPSVLHMKTPRPEGLPDGHIVFRQKKDTQPESQPIHLPSMVASDARQ